MRGGISCAVFCFRIGVTLPDSIFSNSFFLLRKQRVFAPLNSIVPDPSYQTLPTRSSVNTSRYFPITPRIQEILDAVMQLPGESVYLFHDADGNMIKKDGYEQYLRRHVQKLGITGKTNNHAIRKGFNSNILIARGVPANERAAILGHTTRTNERNYSPRKKDSLNRLRDTLSR
ncbi:MAG: tyrosine-type recombinase/integrase [Lachnospiraceae bacterium]|nr:tyrosine-type recombinase/integrase [Lachnospiraceae bacterium]